MMDEGSVRYREALRRGHVAVARGRPREAIAHYEEAARLAERRALPFVCMGSVHLRSNQPREAIRAFERGPRASPRRSQRHAWQGCRAGGGRSSRGVPRADQAGGRAGGHGAGRSPGTGRRRRTSANGSRVSSPKACRPGRRASSTERLPPSMPPPSATPPLPPSRRPSTPACARWRRARVPSTCISRWRTCTCGRAGRTLACSGSGSSTTAWASMRTPVGGPHCRPWHVTSAPSIRRLKRWPPCPPDPPRFDRQTRRWPRVLTPAARPATIAPMLAAPRRHRCPTGPRSHAPSAVGPIPAGAPS